MISITCTNCKAVLAIDDAFAGGVCRCQHCGTIQTVPAKPRPRPAGPSPKPALYQNKQQSRPGAGATGLDELAEAVASSGLAGSGLASGRHQRGAAGAVPAPTAQEAPDRRRLLLPIILIAAAALVVVAGIVLIAVLTRGPKPEASAGTSHPGPEAAVMGPSFCGIHLGGNRVIFLLDRGNSIGDLFDTLKATSYKAIRQLGPDRQFQVILWDNDAGSAEFPSGAMRNATEGALEACKRDFQDIDATGQTHLSGPMKEALDRHPDLIVIATGKADLDEDDAAALSSAAGSGVRLVAIQVGGDFASAALENAARQTGGTFRVVSGPELREFSRD